MDLPLKGGLSALGHFERAGLGCCDALGPIGCFHLYFWDPGIQSQKALLSQPSVQVTPGRGDSLAIGGPGEMAPFRDETPACEA